MASVTTANLVKALLIPSDGSKQIERRAGAYLGY